MRHTLNLSPKTVQKRHDILRETLILDVLVTFSWWVVHVFTQKVNSLLEKISFDRKSSLVHTYVEIRELKLHQVVYYIDRPITHWTNFQCFSFFNVFLSLSHFYFSERLFILKTVVKLNMNWTVNLFSSFISILC